MLGIFATDDAFDDIDSDECDIMRGTVRDLMG
jgi:hypothetical protein